MESKFKYTHLPDTGILAAVDNSGKKLYKAIDFARLLGYKRPDAAVKRLCKTPITLMAPTFNQFGGRFDQPVKFIGEDDATRMLNCCTLPSAARIRRKLEDTLAKEKAEKERQSKDANRRTVIPNEVESFIKGIEAVLDMELWGKMPKMILISF